MVGQNEILLFEIAEIKTEQLKPVIGELLREPAMLRCSTCKEWKDVKQFPENRFIKRGYQYSCRACIREMSKPHKSSAAYKTKRAEQRIKKNYGITLKGKQCMVEKQNGLCAVCGRPFKGTGNNRLAPVIDHNHKTGKIRAVLHGCCNLLIGKALDDPEVLEAAARYLRKHSED